MSQPEGTPRRSVLTDDPRRRFEINVQDTALPKATAIAWRAIVELNTPPQLFAIRRKPVRIVGGEHGEPVSAEYLGIDELKRISARTAFWFRSNKEGKHEAHPVEAVIRDMLADPTPPLPALDRIVAAPVCAADGSISIQPGYNARSLTYFAKDPKLELLPPYETVPDVSEVEGARDFLLNDFLGDFQFVGDADRAHALSAILNPFVRSMIDGPTPMYLIEAPAAGTGKTLLARLAVLPGTGAEPTTIAPANADEEQRKTLTSVLQRMPEAVLIDNVSKELQFPSLASALTADVWTDRMLGRSEIVSVPVRCTWLATANNPTLSRELFRRVVRIRMDAQVERPEQRTGWRHPRIERWARTNRGKLIDAALILIANWIHLGQLHSDHVMGSYDAWAAVHGGILECANVRGFLERRKEDEEAVSPQEAILQAFVERWWQEHKIAKVGVAALYNIAQDIEGFNFGASPSDYGRKKSLGWTLNSLRDRIIGGYRVHFAGTYQGAAQYQLTESGEVPF